MSNGFGLTPVEKNLLCQLLSGESLSAAARALGVTCGVVRLGLLSILQKTEANPHGKSIALFVRDIQLREAAVHRPARCAQVAGSGRKNRERPASAKEHVTF